MLAHPAAQGGLVDSAAVSTGAAAPDARGGDVPGGDHGAAPETTWQANRAEAVPQDAERPAGAENTRLVEGSGLAATTLTMEEPGYCEAAAEGSRVHGGRASGTAIGAIAARSVAAADIGTVADASNAMASDAISSDGVGAYVPVRSDEQRDASSGALLGVLDGIIDAVEAAGDRWAAPRVCTQP